MEADRGCDKPVKMVLHLLDFSGLIIFIKIFVDATDTAGKSHRNGHRSFSYSIHSR